MLKAAIVLPSMEPSPICEFPLTDLLRWNKENFISSLEQNDVVTRVLELKTLLSSESIDCDAGAEQITELLTNLMSKSLRKPRGTRVRTNKNRFTIESAGLMKNAKPKKELSTVQEKT